MGDKECGSLAGLAGCCVESSSPCPELMLCSWEEPVVCEPLYCCPPGVFVSPDCSGSTSSIWVLQKVDDICQCVGLSCYGFEGEFMALLTAIEASYNWGSGFLSPNQSIEDKGN